MWDRRGLVSALAILLAAPACAQQLSSSPAFSGAFFNVEAAGARRDGLTDNTAVFQRAVDSGKPVVIPGPGVYRCGRVLSNASNLDIRGFSDPTIEALPGLTGSMWAFSGNDNRVQGLTFSGPVYTSQSDVISLGSLLRFEAPALAQVNFIQVSDCRFFGSHNPLAVSTGKNVVLRDLYIYRAFEYGITVQYGPQNLLISGVTAEETGFNEGIKFGFAGQALICENVIVDDFTLLNNGKFGGQEGMDLFIGAARYIRISNGLCRGNQNGGVEIKKAVSPGVPDVYEEIIVSGLTIEMTQDQGAGVAFNITGAAIPSGSAGRSRVENVRVVYTGGGIANDALGFQAYAWSDIEFVNCSVSGVHQGVRLIGTGTDDVTIHRPSVVGLHARNCHGGVNFAGGALDDLMVSGCDLISTGNAIYCESGTGQFVNNPRLQSTTDNVVRCDAGTFAVLNNRYVIPPGKAATAGNAVFTS